MVAMTSAGRPTLPGRDYHAADVFELEREKVFFREWFYVGRADQAPEPGDFFTADVVGESVLVVRGKDLELRGFYNVCRHRGSRICDAETHGHAKGAIKCPYHAWSYSYEGELIGTPLIGRDELDRSSLSLWPVSVDVWQGFVFVHLGEPEEGVRESFEHQSDLPLQYEPWRMDELSTAHRTVTELRGQLEDPRGELQRVPPLSDGAPGARRRRADLPQGPRLRRGPRRLGRLDGRRGLHRRPARRRSRSCRA